MIPTINFFTTPSYCNRFVQPQERQDILIRHLICEGYAPEVTAGFPQAMPPVSYFLVEGENELRSDHENLVNLHDVICIIYWPQPIEDLLYQEAKLFFENLFGLKNHDVEVKECFKPYKGLALREPPKFEPTVKLEDGRSVVQVWGGPFEEKVNVLLKSLS